MSRIGLLVFGLLVSSQFVLAEDLQFNYSDTLAVNGATIYQLQPSSNPDNHPRR